MMENKQNNSLNKKDKGFEFENKNTRIYHSFCNNYIKLKMNSEKK